MRRLALVLAAAVAALAGAPVAAADPITTTDAAGRTIAFDVRAEGVDVEWYSDLLRRAAHGDEIERVTIRVVNWEELRTICGSGAAGCYGGRPTRATITVPAGKTPAIVHTVFHEYGHHVDAWRGVGEAAREPNGSATWWRARGIAALLAEGAVSHTYSLGWERSIGEIFAEDYAQLHVESPYRIRWLGAPSDEVRAALRNDLEGVPDAPVPLRTAPLVIPTVGPLRPGRSSSTPFELLGPGRRATFTATIAGPAARARVVLRCEDGRGATRLLAGAGRSATIDLRNLGPARCSVTVRNTGKTRFRFTARLRLALERAGGR